MKEDLQEIKVLLAEIKTDLRHHIKRTDMLDEEIKIFRKVLQPIREHVSFVGTLGRFVTIAAAVAMAIAAFIALK